MIACYTDRLSARPADTLQLHASAAGPCRLEIARVGAQFFQPSDVAGVYGAAGAGLAVGRGVRGIVRSNQKGAVLELSGQQIGLMANADLSGLAISLR